MNDRLGGSGDLRWRWWMGYDAEIFIPFNFPDQYIKAVSIPKILWCDFFSRTIEQSLTKVSNNAECFITLTMRSLKFRSNANTQIYVMYMHSLLSQALLWGRPHHLLWMMIISPLKYTFEYQIYHNEMIKILIGEWNKTRRSHYTAGASRVTQINSSGNVITLN